MHVGMRAVRNIRARRPGRPLRAAGVCWSVTRTRYSDSENNIGRVDAIPPRRTPQFRDLRNSISRSHVLSSVSLPPLLPSSPFSSSSLPPFFSLFISRSLSFWFRQNAINFVIPRPNSLYKQLRSAIFFFFYSISSTQPIPLPAVAINHRCAKCSHQCRPFVLATDFISLANSR